MIVHFQEQAPNKQIMRDDTTLDTGLVSFRNFAELATVRTRSSRQQLAGHEAVHFSRISNPSSAPANSPLAIR